MLRTYVWWVVLISGIVTILAQDGLIVEGFVDTTACLTALNDADVDSNGGVDSEEYVGFVQSQDYTSRLGNVEFYEDMPLVLQATFVTLACLCRDARFGGDPSDTTCCLGDNARISSEAPTNTGERTMVFATCFLTDQAISQVLASGSPSTAPTNIQIPTVVPTQPPTDLPSASTITPTLLPTTAVPTVTPGSPTQQPSTSRPTDSPSTSIPTTSPPVVKPTKKPTLSPVTSPPTPTLATPPPTLPPTLPPTPTPTPTLLPNVPPTSPPTLPPTPSIPDTIPPVISAPALVAYDIATDSTNLIGGPYINDLVAAMDRLAPEVALEVFPTRVRRSLQAVSVRLPTSITNLRPIECPFDIASDRCEKVTAEIVLLSLSPTDPMLIEYQNAILAAIQAGRLQEAIDVINLDAAVLVLTGVPTILQAETEGDDSLPSGATAGIVIAALAAAILPLGLYLAMRKRHEAKPNYDIYEAEDAPQDIMGKKSSSGGDGAGGNFGADDGIGVGVGVETGVGGTMRADPGAVAVAAAAAAAGTVGVGTSVGTGTGTLGAKKPDYGKREDLESDQNIEDTLDIAPDSSSNAGSSGWSSSAGLSSLNTGSADDSMDAAAAAGASLAVIGAASGITRRMQQQQSEEDTNRSIQSTPSVSRADLDSAIEAGDWAAVGATAALLAAASDSQSAGDTSGGKSGVTSASSIDAARAAELDHLVDAGDWEGVVMAAAKFEAAESSATGEGSVRSGTVSSARTTSTGGVGSSTGSGTYDPSVSTSVSESASKAQKRAEIRTEVEALVRRVVPEEIDNVDEMMLQFKGREEELVETLRTMQERMVAQKARAAGHKAAKQEARKNVQRGVVPGTQPQRPVSTGPAAPESPPSSSTAADSIAVVAASEQDTTTQMHVPASTSTASQHTASAVTNAADAGSGASASESEISARQMRTALELAIEAGDWDAVGEAAALMSDTSVTSGSTNRSSRGGPFSTASSATQHFAPVSGVNADRARELDEMIDRGDWTGVVAAAGRFSRADKSHHSSSAESSDRERGSSSRDGADSRSRRLREEADALAQAEIWMAIAEQSKTEGATDVGASDAADWAIARSLSRLRQAEKSGTSNSANVERSSQGTRDEDESV